MYLLWGCRSDCRSRYDNFVYFNRPLTHGIRVCDRKPSRIPKKRSTRILKKSRKVRGKISAQPHPTLCIQFLNRENNNKNNTFPLGKQICFTIVWGCAETLPQSVWGCRKKNRGPVINSIKTIQAPYSQGNVWVKCWYTVCSHVTCFPHIQQEEGYCILNGLG